MIFIKLFIKKIFLLPRVSWNPDSLEHDAYATFSDKSDRLPIYEFNADLFFNRWMAIGIFLFIVLIIALGRLTDLVGGIALAISIAVPSILFILACHIGRVDWVHIVDLPPLMRRRHRKALRLIKKYNKEKIALKNYVSKVGALIPKLVSKELKDVLSFSYLDERLFCFKKQDYLQIEHNSRKPFIMALHKREPEYVLKNLAYLQDLLNQSRFMHNSQREKVSFGGSIKNIFLYMVIIIFGAGLVGLVFVLAGGGALVSSIVDEYNSPERHMYLSTKDTWMEQVGTGKNPIEKFRDRRIRGKLYSVYRSSLKSPYSIDGTFTFSWIEGYDLVDAYKLIYKYKIKASSLTSGSSNYERVKYYLKKYESWMVVFQMVSESWDKKRQIMLEEWERRKK